MSDVRVVLAAHALLTAEGIKRILADGGFDVVAVARDADDLLAAVPALEPDVAVIASRLGPTRTDENIRAAIAVRGSHPAVGTMILGRRVELDLVTQMVADRADRLGYLLKDRLRDVQDFLDAVATVAAGGSCIDPVLVARLVNAHREDVASLTPREREVLGRMAEGATNVGIARRLGISSRAVEKHAASVFDKLGLPAGEDAHRRVLAVLRYLSR